MKTTSSLIRTIYLTLVLVLVSTLLHAQQLKLGDNPSTIQKSALLELDSKTQGLLLPRISDTTSQTMVNAPTGMIIFLTTNNTFCVRVNGGWLPLVPAGGVAGGDLTGNYPNPVIANGAVTGTKIAQGGATNGQVLKWNGSLWAPAADDNTGTISSIGMSLPAPFIVSPTTLTGNGTFTIGMLNQPANTVFAAPNGAAGTGTFRVLVAGDIPALPFSKISGVVPIAQGGTGLTAVGAAGTVLTSNGTSLTYAAPASTAFSLSGDVTGSGSGTVTTTIANQAVTFAKMQNINTQKLMGRFAAGAGSPQEVGLDNTLKLNTGGTLYADSAMGVWNASRLLGKPLSVVAPATGQVLKWDGTNWSPATDNNTGSLSSIGLTLPTTVFNVTNSPLTANGTINAALQNQAGNTVFAAPSGVPVGTPSFRSLVATDIPALPFSQITGIVPIAQGGTALTAVGANGTFLTSNGTSLAYRALAAADLPTIPFSKISGVVPIAQGGTGLTAVGAAGTVLTSNGTSLTYAAPASSALSLTGDVTGTASAGTLPATISNGAVTYAKIQNVTSQRLLGRYSTGTGTTQEVPLDNTLKFTTGGTLYADSSLAVWNASKVLGMRVSPKAPTTGEVLKWTGSAWETSADNDGGATYAVLASNDISTADVSGTPAPPVKFWASNLTGTVVNGVTGTTASSWNVMSFRGSGFTTQLYFDKNTMAMREWVGNTAPLTTTGINGWYKAIVTNGNNTITNGSIIFGNVTSDASSEVGQDNANLFYDNTTQRLGVGTNTPASTLTVVGSVSMSIRSNPTSIAATDYTIIKTTQNTTTYNLPSANTASLGRILIFKVSSNAPGNGGNAPKITLTAPGGNNIDDGGNGGSVTIAKGAFITLQSDGNGTWWILSQ